MIFLAANLWGFVIEIVLLVVSQRRYLTEATNQTAPSNSSLCNFGGLKIESNWYLTMPQRHDGFGAMSQHVIAAAAFCHKHKWNFAGMYEEKLHNSHGISGSEFVDFFFGDRHFMTNASYLQAFGIESNCSDTDWIKVHDKNALLKIANFSEGLLRLNHKKYMVEFTSSFFPLDAITSRVSSYLDYVFLHRLRKGALCGIQKSMRKINYFGPRQSSNNSINVAVHIRRGDINPAHHENRWVPIDVYVDLLTHLEAIHPKVTVHIFSSYKNDEDTKQFEPLSNLGWHVHANKEGDHSTDISIAHVAHFATADILFLGKSGFSHTAGYLNPNCVIYFPFWHKPLDQWIVLSNSEDVQANKEILSQQLGPCLHRLNSQHP